MSQDGSRDYGGGEEEGGQRGMNLEPKLVASTGEAYCCSIVETLRKEKGETEAIDTGDGNGIREYVSHTSDKTAESNYFKSAQW